MRLLSGHGKWKGAQREWGKKGLHEKAEYSRHMKSGCCIEAEGGVGGDMWKQLFVMGKKCESWLKKKKII